MLTTSNTPIDFKDYKYAIITFERSKRTQEKRIVWWHAEMILEGHGPDFTQNLCKVSHTKNQPITI